MNQVEYKFSQLQKERYDSLKMKKQGTWHKWFAWYPIKIIGFYGKSRWYWGIKLSRCLSTAWFRPANKKWIYRVPYSSVLFRKQLFD